MLTSSPSPTLAQELSNFILRAADLWSLFFKTGMCYIHKGLLHFQRALSSYLKVFFSGMF